MSALSLTSHASRKRRSRRGVALPAALMLIVVLSAIAAGGFSMIEGERKVLTDQEAFGEAYNLARSAFDRFMATPTVSLPAINNGAWTGPDSVQFTFPNGYAWVMVQQVRPASVTDEAMYLVRSRGVRTTYRSGNTPAAERIFAQFARWETASIPTPAAWTSLTGLLKNGGSGIISGSDACGASPSVGGVAVPTIPGYVQNGGAPVPSGSPNVVDLGTQALANESVSSIDWDGIVNGQTMVPDYILPTGGWPGFADPTVWPVIYVDQVASWSLPSSGRGLLVVRNSMTLGGSLSWDGIILVGGTLTSNGNNTVSGAVITGLNVTLGLFVPPNDIGNGTKTFKFNSCNVANALSHFNGLRTLRNTTVDNWPSY